MRPRVGDIYFTTIPSFGLDPGSSETPNAHDRSYSGGQSVDSSLSDISSAYYHLLLTGELAFNQDWDVSNGPLSIEYGVLINIYGGSLPSLFLSIPLNEQQYYVGSVNYRRNFSQQSVVELSEDTTLFLRASVQGVLMHSVQYAAPYFNGFTLEQMSVSAVVVDYPR